MLEHNMFVVKEKAKFLSSRESYEILDETGNLIGTAEQRTGLLAKLLGAVTGDPSTEIEFREKPDDSLVFSVRRKGLLFKKVQCLDAQGAVLGTYKAKRFSLKGGFHVYDKDGAHIAEIRGAWTKAEYTFYTPSGNDELGKVSKKWGGAMRELFSGADTYGVQITPFAAENPKTKMLMLGAAVAIDCLMGGKTVVVAGGGKAEQEKEEKEE